MKTATVVPRLIVLSTFVVLTGCAVQGRPFEPFQPPKQKAVIYVYRPYGVFGSGLVPTVNCGENGIAIGPGGYHAYSVDPGTVSCNAHTEVTAEAEIEAIAGEQYYIKEELGWGFFIGHPHLTRMDPEVARAEIADCKRQ